MSISLTTAFGVEAGDGFKEPPLPEFAALIVILGYIPDSAR
jgi:hypothetical protein